MIMPEFKMRRVRNPLEWLRIYRLYKNAFPGSERKPFRMIVKMQLQGRGDVWCLKRGRKFAGFASTINSERLILLDYLAVPRKLRSHGAGSSALRAMQQAYAGKGLFVEIESSFEDTPDRPQRLRRKQFYMKNDMQPMGVMASVFGVKMELLGVNCRIDFPAYHAFYRDYYSQWAADHIFEAEYPEN